MQEAKREGLLFKGETKRLLERHEESEFQVNSGYDDFRAPLEYEMEAWTNDTETLFTLPEIILLFS
jgi:hypothetical protein